MPATALTREHGNRRPTFNLTWSKKKKNQTAHCNSIPTNFQWIGTALEEQSYTHFSDACCHEEILEL